MKIQNLILIFLSIGLTANAQERKILVALNNSGTFIETYYKNEPLKMNGTVFTIYDFKLNSAFRLGPSSTNTLKEGIKTAIKWIKLNEQHQKDFEKEICRFKAMDTETFKIHGYIDQFSAELILKFKGFSNGTFELEIKSNERTILGPYGETFDDLDYLTNFLSLLNGKAIKNDINDIFKN
jgi:hypothetical protein